MRDQTVCQPVGPSVELLVCQRRGLVHNRDGRGSLGGLPCEQIGERHGGNGRGGVVVRVQQALSLPRRQHVRLGDRPVWCAGEEPQHAGEPGRDGLGCLPLEETLSVLQRQAQVRVGGSHHGHRVVGDGERADAGDLDPGRGVGVADPGTVHGVGLEGDERVEEGVESGQPVDVGEPVVVVLQEGGLPVLQPGQQPGRGVGRCAPHPYGHGVDEHPHHRVGSRDGGGTAGDSGAEHHVLTASQRSEQESPGALQDRVDRDAQFGGAAGQLLGVRCGQGDVDVSDLRCGRCGRQ